MKYRNAHTSRTRLPISFAVLEGNTTILVYHKVYSSTSEFKLNGVITIENTRSARIAKEELPKNELIKCQEYSHTVDQPHSI